MKKRVKRLALNRETLVRLENNLEQVVGGITAVADCGTRTCAPPHSGCEWSGYRTCNSCQNTCTTNYC
jgi:hypothetical protein